MSDHCRPPRASPIRASARSIAWKTAGRPGWTSRSRWPARRPNSASSRRCRRGDRARGAAGTAGSRPHRRGLRAHRPHHRAAGLGTVGRVVGEPHGGWVHWGATTQNITQTGDLLVLRQAHGIFLRPDRRGADRDGRSGGARRGHAAARPHPWPARGAGDVRLQGRGVDRRTAAPCRAAAPGGAADVRCHAGRRRRDLRLARQAGAAGAGGHRQAARLRLDGGAVARARRPSGGEHLPARPAGRDLRQDRPRDLHADEDRVRRGRGTGAARHRRQFHHAAEAQSETVPGHHRRRGRGARAWCRWRWRRCRPSTRPTAPPA